MYDRCVNKKWEERKNPYESKKVFIDRIISEWNRVSDIEKNNFLKAPAPVHKSKIQSFFTVIKKISHIPPVSNNETLTISETVTITEAVTIEPQSDSSTSITIEPAIPNASSAPEDRELFLCHKENSLMKAMLCEMGGCFNNAFFTNEIISDTGFIRLLRSLSYRWNEFSMLRKGYTDGQIKGKASKLREQLLTVTETSKILSQCILSITEIKTILL